MVFPNKHNTKVQNIRKMEKKKKKKDTTKGRKRTEIEKQEVEKNK